MSVNRKASFIVLILLIVTIGVGIAFYSRESVVTVSYTGLDNSTYENVLAAKSDIEVTDEVRDSEKIEFVQRTITGGGINPGWVISILETQPNTFTGRVIIDDGVYQHSVLLKEEVTNIFIGEMVGSDKKTDIFSIRKENKECTDEEGNIFQYSLDGTYGSKKFSGCGGDVLTTS